MKTNPRRNSFVLAALMVWGLAGCSPAASAPSAPAKEKTAQPAANAPAVATATISSTTSSAASSSSASKAEGWGSLKGKFVYDGTPPTPEKINTQGKDPGVCDKVPLFDESLIVGPDGGIANVLVYVKTKGVAVHPDYAKTASDKIVLDNKNCRFEPHIVPIVLTQTLVAKNSDPTGHNTNIQPPLDTPQSLMIPAGGDIEFKFSRSQTVPTQAVCNIHPWMMAYVLPRDNPYVAVSKPDGSFEIKNLPAGDLEFTVWKEKVGYLAAKPEWTKGVIKATIKSGDANDLGTINVSPDLLKPKS